jgi:hypothetical protein
MAKGFIRSSRDKENAGGIDGSGQLNQERRGVVNGNMGDL